MKRFIFTATLFAALFVTSPSRATFYDYTFSFTATSGQFFSGGSITSFTTSPGVEVTGEITGIAAGTTTDLTSYYLSLTSVSQLPFLYTPYTNPLTLYCIGCNGSSSPGPFITTDANGNVLAATFVNVGSTMGYNSVGIGNSFSVLILDSPTAALELFGGAAVFSAPLPGTPAVIPLPASVWLFGSCSAAGWLLMVYRRRRADGDCLAA
jgi:hypothetical protein